METEVRTVARKARSSVDVEELKIIAIFCGLGLLLSLLAAMSGTFEFGAF